MTARRATRSARPSVIAISLSTATTAVSRKIRDGERADRGDHEADTRSDPTGKSQDSPFPLESCWSGYMFFLKERSRSDSALLQMLVSYALSIIRPTAAHYAEYRMAGESRMKKTRRGLCVFLFFFFLSFLILIVYIVFHKLHVTCCRSSLIVVSIVPCVFLFQ